jgi:hypothetical protein
MLTEGTHSLFSKEKHMLERTKYRIVPPQMIGFPLKPSPPKLGLTVIGKSGRFLQVVADDSRSMTSQLSNGNPPQMSALERPFYFYTCTKASTH